MPTLPKVIALDLDGTLLRNDRSISPRTLQTIERALAHGRRVVIATSRPPRSVRRMLPSLLHPVPWVCYDGAEILHQGQTLFQNFVPPPLAKDIIGWLQALAPGIAVSVEMDDCLYANQLLSQPWQYEVCRLETILDKAPAKILFDVTRLANLPEFRERFEDRCRITFFERENLGQISACSVSKATALDHLLAQWQLNWFDVIAFGDDMNDLEMITKSGIGVAMGNACEPVRLAAKRTTGTNDEDGVATILDVMDV